MPIEATRLAGKFIVLDGPDGAGKGTQLDRLETALTEAGVELVRARDPGGTEIGERIRDLLLNHAGDDMDVRCETLLFMASRAQLMREVVEPTLDAGKTVLCDRFVSATCAYQGAAGFDLDYVLDLARLTIHDCWPDLTIVLDVEAEQGLERIASRGSNPTHRGSATELSDALERRPIDYHKKVREIFLSLPERYPAPVEIVDGRGSPEEVTRRLLEVIGRVGA